MLKMLTFAAALTLAAAAAAQDKTVTTADFVGTWNIEVMSHQIALVVEPAEGNKVTATMMMMGRDTLLKGELTDRTLTLVGVKTETNGAPEPQHAAHEPPSNAKPIVVTLQDDGTIAGEMMTSAGPVKWTGEKLRAKQKG
jgi:putative methionine-R-sulfoxide reductase with GAF domain